VAKGRNGSTPRRGPRTLGPAGTLARTFIDSKLTPLIIAASLLVGLVAAWSLPREEEPQIVVPMIDVMVSMPGATAPEVEERVTKPLEKFLWEIPGVEYVYSTSSPGAALAVVRFLVGQNEEDALVRLHQKLGANQDLIPPGAGPPLVKQRSIDDVPIVALTFWGEGFDHYALRRLAAAVHDRVKEIPDVSEAKLIGGQRRQVQVVIDTARLTAYGLAPAALAPVLQAANRLTQTGSFSANNREVLVEGGELLQDASAVGAVVVGVHNGLPVFLRDVARIEDGPEEAVDYVLYAPGPAAEAGRRIVADRSHVDLPANHGFRPAVTLSIAKRKGTNAIDVADAVLRKVESLYGTVLPKELQISVTRNYGVTALDKSNELLYHMGLAVLSVSLLVALALGVRSAGVVAVAIPVTLALTLATFHLYGYTLNRVTLFALIFSIGILVDDAIVVVENIVRHARLPENRGRPMVEVAPEAVDEVGNPTILATLTVIAAIVPMAFVSGLMGPYMRPIPIGASAAMVYSLLVAFVITPWAALRLLGDEARTHRRTLCWREWLQKRFPALPPHAPHAVSVERCDAPANPEGWSVRLYRRVMTPLLQDALTRRVFLTGVWVLLAAAICLIPLQAVVVKMLPFDNKSEFQVVVDMPEGTTLEGTAAVTLRIGDYLRIVPEVADLEVYVGNAAPYNFNGLVRHYFLRRSPNVADIQVNLVPKDERAAQSHDIARRVRGPIQEIAAASGARVKVVEIPPGPPVLQTLVLEVYGPDYQRQIALAQQIRDLLDGTDGVVDVDWYVEDPQPKVRFHVDQQKAAHSGVSTADVADTLALAVGGLPVGLLHDAGEREDVTILLKLPREERSSVGDLGRVHVQSRDGRLVPISQLVRVDETAGERSVYRKNLQPVVYVTADVAGRTESPVYAILELGAKIDAIPIPEGYTITQYTARQPFTTDHLAMKWDGEWHITYEVFRDLGLAFAVVLVLIYILVVGWFQSLSTPRAIMAAIPFSLVGILPAHWLLGAYFTATSMIGFIAGAGIVVRNSIILVDFIELRLRQGMPLAEAVVDAGAIRFRPMMLTAAAVIVGSSVILFDPIFQGMAVALMAGEVASLLLSRMTVPVLYYLQKRQKPLPIPLAEVPVRRPATALATAREPRRRAAADGVPPLPAH
jgi:multidrug efflux pump subunit AcrB